jgi:N-dimethylarginine dimethylaminohydrolase
VRRLQQEQSAPLIRAVRGRGLWVGVELDPRRVSARAVVERLAEHGVLTKETHETVIRFAPPLMIDRAALDWGIDVFAEVLQQFMPAPAHEAGAARTLSSRSLTRPPMNDPRPTATSATARPPQGQLMMSAPDHFAVGDCGPADAAPAAQAARGGWTQLRQTCERLAAAIEVQPAVAGLPDLVFAARSAAVLDRKVVLARFACPARQGEQRHNRAFFEAMRARGSVDAIVEPPAGEFFEGASDALWDATRSLLWAGQGRRSTAGMPYFLAETYGVPVVALELVDPRLHHLDSCLCVLDGGEVLYWRAAFAPRSLALLHELVGGAQLIEVGDDDARQLAINAVSLGRDAVLCHASAGLRAQLSERGYQVHVVPLDPFARSGGAAHGLTLRLDRSSRPLPQRETFVEDDLAELRRAA